MLALVISLSALAGPPPPPIVNGELEEGFPSALSIGFPAGAQSFSFCSATLITPRIILTAAHCSDDDTLRNYGIDAGFDAILPFISAIFGPDITEAGAESAIKFASVVGHPDYVPLSGSGRNLGEYDVSIMVLEEDAPVEPAWVRLDVMDAESVEGEEVYSVGFGLNEQGRADGKKRSAPLTVDTLDEMFLISYSETNGNGANICSGDSGGPQYKVDDAGREIVWGVHSWGDSDCLSSSGSTRTDVFAEWLRGEVFVVHGTDDLCEAAGRYDDGVCDDTLCTADPDCAVADKEEARAGCATVPGAVGFAPLLLALAGALRRRR